MDNIERVRWAYDQMVAIPFPHGKNSEIADWIGRRYLLEDSGVAGHAWSFLRGVRSMRGLDPNDYIEMMRELEEMEVELGTYEYFSLNVVRSLLYLCWVIADAIYQETGGESARPFDS